MQTKSEYFGEFLSRTDRLAAHLRINVSELTNVIHLSNGMLFAYRKGNHPISLKAWSKLEAAEEAAGIKHQTQASPPDLLYRIREEFYLPNESDLSGKTPGEVAEILQAMADAMEEMDRRRSAFTNRLLDAAKEGGLSVKIKSHKTFTKSSAPITDTEITDARAKLDDLKHQAGLAENQPRQEDRRKRA